MHRPTAGMTPSMLNRDSKRGLLSPVKALEMRLVTSSWSKAVVSWGATNVAAPSSPTHPAASASRPGSGAYTRPRFLNRSRFCHRQTDSSPLVFQKVLKLSKTSGRV